MGPKRTFDISVQLVLGVQVFQTLQQLPRENRDIVLSKHARLELFDAFLLGFSRQKSKRDIPSPRMNLPSNTP
jgi:hypothetical protein